MAHSRRSTFPKTGGPSRQVSWEVGPRGSVATSTTSNSLFPTAAEAALDKLTIVRTRGQLIVEYTTGDAVAEGHEWAFGMCIVSQNAAGIGVTAVPDPLIDIAWEGWFVYEMGIVKQVGTTLDQSEIGAGQRIEIDSKAMRKLRITDNVVAVFSNTIVGSPGQVRASMLSRMLVKLP